MMSGTRIVLSVATVVAALSAGPVFAADDGYQDVFSSVLGAVGVLKTDETPEIDYRERAPLVLPPKPNLVKPVEPGAARTAAWPQDPDVIKRRKAGEAARAPSPNLLGNSRDVLSKDELVQGRTASQGNSVRPSNCGSEGNARGCLVLSPDELKAEQQHYEATRGADTKKEYAAGEEPDRLYLTQPPKGYLKTTKTVKATPQAPVIKIDESNPKAALVYRPKPEDE